MMIESTAGTSTGVPWKDRPQRERNSFQKVRAGFGSPRFAQAAVAARRIQRATGAGAERGRVGGLRLRGGRVPVAVEGDVGGDGAGIGIDRCCGHVHEAALRLRGTFTVPAASFHVRAPRCSISVRVRDGRESTVRGSEKQHFTGAGPGEGAWGATFAVGARSRRRGGGRGRGWSGDGDRQSPVVPKPARSRGRAPSNGTTRPHAPGPNVKATQRAGSRCRGSSRSRRRRSLSSG
jgi:hypothetical protein